MRLGERHFRFALLLTVIASMVWGFHALIFHHAPDVFLIFDGHFVIISLIKADDLAAGEVNGGKNLHLSPSFFQKKAAEAAFSYSTVSVRSRTGVLEPM